MDGVCSLHYYEHCRTSQKTGSDSTPEGTKTKQTKQATDQKPGEGQGFQILC